MVAIDDAIHKLNWGQQHMQNLIAKLKARDPNDFGIKHEHNPHPTIPNATQVILKISKLPIIEKEIGILIGETIQSFRSCLDYLAWILVQNNNDILREEQARGVAFPMARNDKSFWSQADKKLINVPMKQKTIIETYQPYNSTTAGRAMLYLRTLSDTDKHRIIIPAYYFPQEVELKGKPEGVRVIDISRDYTYGEELKVGTKLITVNLEGATIGKTKLNTELRVQAELMFPHSLILPPPQFEAVTLGKVFEIISSTCFDILANFRFDN